MPRRLAVASAWPCRGSAWSLMLRAIAWFRRPPSRSGEQRTDFAADRHVRGEHHAGRGRRCAAGDAGAGGTGVAPSPDGGAGAGLPWPSAQGYPDFIRSLDPLDPRTVPMMTACTTLMRGAAYAMIEPQMELDRHAAVAAPYARHSAAAPVGGSLWAGDGGCCVRRRPRPRMGARRTAGLPTLMREADRRARTVERADVDLVEAGVLTGREGETFEAVGLARRRDATTIQPRRTRGDRAVRR